MDRQSQVGLDSGLRNFQTSRKVCHDDATNTPSIVGINVTMASDAAAKATPYTDAAVILGLVEIRGVSSGCG
jgi:hypothetical protein